MRFAPLELVALCCALPRLALAEDEVQYLPGFGAPLEPVFSGLLPCNPEANGKLFYMLFHAQQGGAEQPLIIWLNGGPGASSALGNFLENGPYRLHPDQTLTRNPGAWNKDAHVMYVDNPVGTGYSTSEPHGYVRDYDELARQFYEGLSAFFSRHSWLKPRAVYMAGESFAGVYIPKISAHILRQRDTFGLSGVLIGNPGNLDWRQYESQMDMFRAFGLVGDQVLQEARRHWRNCSSLMEAERKADAFEACEAMSNTLMTAAGNPFIYDLRQWGDVYNAVLAPAMKAYLASAETKRALNVPEGTVWQNGDGTAAPNPVVNALRGQLMVSVLPEMAEILDRGLHVTIYDGVMDGSSCNHLGVFQSLERLPWDGRSAFLAAPRQQWHTPGITHPIGFVQASGGLTFKWVSNAGHLVPTDQPEAAAALIHEFLHGAQDRTSAVDAARGPAALAAAVPLPSAGWAPPFCSMAAVATISAAAGSAATFAAQYALGKRHGALLQPRLLG